MVPRRVASAGICCAVALTVLVGCTSIPTDEDSSDACLRVRDVRGCTALHDRYVFIRAARERNYLLEVDLGCNGLLYGTGIFISNDVDRVCSSSGATISFWRFDAPVAAGS